MTSSPDDGSTLRAIWEEQGSRWVALARDPADSYWQYRDAFFAEIVPAPGRATLDVGCGEGRVARDLRDRGHVVTGVDASPTLLREAAASDPGGTYVEADAAELPFEDGSFDLAVAYNSLMDFDDMAGAVREAARVLVPGGRFAISVVHPLAYAGGFDSRRPDAVYSITGSYLVTRRVVQAFRREEVEAELTSIARPLEEYSRALEDAGLLVERLREPAAPVSAVEDDPGEARWQRLPLFLHLLALRP